MRNSATSLKKEKKKEKKGKRVRGSLKEGRPAARSSLLYSIVTICRLHISTHTHSLSKLCSFVRFYALTCFSLAFSLFFSFVRIADHNGVGPWIVSFSTVNDRARRIASIVFEIGSRATSRI